MEDEGRIMELESIPNDTENRQEEWYQQLSLDNVKAFIRSNIAAASRSFIAIGYYLKYARDKKLYEEDGHASIWEFAREEYGISKSTASRYMTMNDRFSEGGNSPIVAKEYRGYGKSQLQEMLYLNDEQLEQVTPDTQVKQIREIRQPVREVPYFELPGQLSIDDFPDVMPEDAAKVQREEGLHPEYDGENTLPATEERKELFSDSDEEDDESFEELPELEPVQEKEESELTDLQIAREELERAQRLLDKCLLDLPDESNIYIRRLKTKVDALACYVCELDDIENPAPKPVQPELPLLKNNDQRAAFVDDYETWPLWIETKETGERYYRYDLEDGTSMVVKVYHAKLFDYKTEGLIYEERFAEGYGRHEYYLLEPGKFFRNCATNRSNLIEKLKKIQKKETGIGNSCDFVGANKMMI